MNYRFFIYVWREVLPALGLGVISFIFVLLMFQILRLMEFFLVHGVGLSKILDILWSMSISFVPTLLPMSTLFSVVLAYSRFSTDSESVAFISIGLSPWQAAKPVVGIGLIAASLSIYAAFTFAPNGNRQFEILMHELSQTKAQSAIRENTFTETFSNMVLFALGSDSKSGSLNRVFIFDEQDPNYPLAIIAKKGLLFNKEQKNSSSSDLWLKLFNGDIHRQEQSHTKINFEEFEVKLIDGQQFRSEAEKSPNSWNIYDIIRYQSSSNFNANKLPLALLAKIEIHKRLAVGGACLILAVLGFGLGFNPNRRTKANGFVLSLAIVFGYWLIMLTLENMSRNYLVNPAIALWLPNVVLAIWSYLKLRQWMQVAE